MSFSNAARDAADPTRATAYRVYAFCHCLERFAPFGYYGTWRYLASTVGAADGHWTSAQLTQAIDLLVRERDRFLAFNTAWEARRRALKASGQRMSAEEQAERQARPWLSWPQESIGQHRAEPPLPPDDAFPFRPTDSADYDAVCAMVPAAATVRPMSFTVKVYDDWVRVPERIYNPEPTAEQVSRLTERQQVMLHCLYTRHHDGHVRQRHVRPLLELAEPWIAPYVVALVGEYVVEIVRDIATGLLPKMAAPTAHRIVYGRFSRDNPSFVVLTHQRVMSYWREYHSQTYDRPAPKGSVRKAPGRDEYPGFPLVRMLQAAAAER